MRISVVSVVGDAGGAEALAPVLSLLGQRRALGDVLTGGPAGAVLDRARVLHRPMRGADDALDLLAGLAPTLLLTGTSWGDEPIELRFIAAAQRLGIPSLSVIDFWSNYLTRFMSKTGRLILPDRIAVPDEAALVEARAEGLPDERLVATGNPHYEHLLQRYLGFDREARLAFREKVGVARNATMILFASQPIRALYGDQLGYDEDQALGLAAGALARVAEWVGHPVTLAVRRHPREAAKGPPASTHAVAVIDGSEHDALSWALAADLVVGMNSAVLLQAAMLGARVVSLQPGLIGIDRLPSNRLGLSDVVTEATDAPSALYRALSRPAHLASGRALQRVRAAAGGATLRLLEVAVTMGTRVTSEIL